jgi:hypothetical protein
MSRRVMGVGVFSFPPGALLSFSLFGNPKPKKTPTGG